MEIKKIKIKINSKDLLKKIGAFFDAHEKAVLFGLFLIFLGYCGYLWYAYANNYHWSDAKKQEYSNTKNAGTSFNKAKFESVVNNLDSRRQEYEKTIDNPKDIFKLKQ